MNPISRKLFTGGIGAAFVLGAFGGGWIVNKVWWARAHQSKYQSAQGKIKELEQTISLTRTAREQADGINTLLRDTLTTIQGTVKTLSEENVSLAQSRAPRVERITKETVRTIDAIPDLDACYSLPLDDRVRDIIWPPTN